MPETQTAKQEVADPVEHLLTILEEKGGTQYGGEEVNQLTHALQCATLAQENGAPESLVAAALLHDVGHLVNPKAEGAAEAGIDAAHERIGAGYLARWFGPAVTTPVAQHVAAKRYLCQAEAGYFERLSSASVLSLQLQGGPFSAAEADAFLAGPYAREAVDLRRWDEAAKDPAKQTASLRAFGPLLERVLAAQS